MYIFQKCWEFTSAKEAMQAGFYPYFIPLTENEGTVAEFRGHRLIMCGSNNYLGLTTHPKVRQAAKDAINRYGTSCTGSRFLNGTLEMHEQLERELAEWVGKQAAIVFSTGMQTNLGAISSLVGRGDVAILDKDDHASIVDGARLSWGETKRYRHNDMADLERVLKNVSEEKGKLLVVDGLFSMGGDIAPLDQILPICKRYNTRVMVDDAHGDGVLGKDGRGIVDHFGLEGRVDIDMGTLSKAFGCLGGYIAGRKELRDYLINTARSFIYTTAHPPSVPAAAMEAIRMIQDEPQHLRQLWENTLYFKKGMGDLGFDIGHSQTPITPVMAGESRAAVELSRQLFEEGLFAKPIVFPLVAKDKARVRINVTAQHMKEDLDEALVIFERVGKRMKLI